MSRQDTYGELHHYPSEVTPPKTSRRNFNKALIGSTVVGVASLSGAAGYMLGGRSPEKNAGVVAEEDPGDDQLAFAGENPTEAAQDEGAMAPDSNEGQIDTGFNYSTLSVSENLTAPDRMSAVDIRIAHKENRGARFREVFYTDKSEVLLPNGGLDVLKAGNAYLAGVEALLKAGCDRETLEERRYLDDPTPERFVSDMAAIYDMPMIRGICGFSMDMPTDEYLLNESVGFKELTMAAEASRRLFWQNAMVMGNLNQRVEVAHLDSEFSEPGPIDFQGKDRYRVNMYAQLSNGVPSTDEQPIPIHTLEGRIPMTVDISPDRPQVTFIRIADLDYADSPLEQLGRQH